MPPPPLHTFLVGDVVVVVVAAHAADAVVHAAIAAALLLMLPLRLSLCVHRRRVVFLVGLQWELVLTREATEATNGN